MDYQTLFEVTTVGSTLSDSHQTARKLSLAHDRTIRLWDAATGQPLGEPLRGHEHSVTAVGFSPDGSQIVSGSSDRTIRLWDAATGQPLGEPLRSHEAPVYAVGFSPDATQIVSGSCDATIRPWNVVTGQPLRGTPRSDVALVTAVGFSPDNSSVVSGLDNSTILSCRLTPDRHDNQVPDPVHSNLITLADGVIPGSRLSMFIPGFTRCVLMHDGWVNSDGRYLFWVPPNNRHGLLYPRARLTIPTDSHLRMTRLDFAKFRCGLSWTEIRSDLEQ
ncbi:related to WD40-repeat protein (notchless protein) [Serendipita indica DSM 11827]|uniref:Related to WD40-repeat protein (Notchless protein) n=1 Tax=Serendipita indica (strain DSM 11827) TaxID=1109443 RepID=G4T8N5_SERID|nr:related to WD40-repeat protein (notchless protein) [Serendipita indica DSM 11827]